MTTFNENHWIMLVSAELLENLGSPTLNSSPERVTENRASNKTNCTKLWACQVGHRLSAEKLQLICQVKNQNPNIKEHVKWYKVRLGAKQKEREGERCLGGLVAKRREESGGGGAARTRSKIDGFSSPETVLTAPAIDTKCNRRSNKTHALVSPS